MAHPTAPMLCSQPSQKSIRGTNIFHDLQPHILLQLYRRGAPSHHAMPRGPLSAPSGGSSHDSQDRTERQCIRSCCLEILMTRRICSWSTNSQLNALVGNKAVLLRLSVVWSTFTYENIVRMLQSHVQNLGVAQPFSGKTLKPTERPAAGDRLFVLPVIRG